MPVMDGLEAARVLVGRRPSADRPRLAATTAGVWDEDRLAVEAAGMDDFLPKPVALDAPASVLARCGRVRRAPVPPPRGDPEPA